jgi:hypothetical protein
MAEAVRYRNKGIQYGTGMLRYRTEMLGAEIQMPAAWVSISFDDHAQLRPFHIASFKI